MPLDLIEAVIAQLENDPSVTAAFGDTWNQTTGSGVPKFFTDYAAQVAEPYCVIAETGETYDYMTRAAGGVVNFTSPGQMMFSIFATGRYQARQLGFVLARSLNDAPLSWPGQVLMEFRMIRSLFNPMATSGPGVPTVFNRIFTFEYMYSGSL